MTNYLYITLGESIMQYWNHIACSAPSRMQSDRFLLGFFLSSAMLMALLDTKRVVWLQRASCSIQALTTTKPLLLHLLHLDSM